MAQDTPEGEPQVVSTGPTARVADSYGYDPHEHKPSQDPFAPDVDEDKAEAKQAATGGAEVDDETAELAAEPYETTEGEPSPGNSSSTSESSSESTPEKDSESAPRRAPSVASRSAQAPKDSSTARSTGTARKAK